MTFINDIKKPINFISIGIAVLSIILAIIFYIKSKEERSISFAVDYPASLVYDSKNSSQSFNLVLNNSTVINENVYLIKGVIKNTGDLPINKEDVRKPLSLAIYECKQILDYKIVEQVDPEVANFKLGPKNSRRSIGIDWSYFDPGYGFRFQILFVGKSEPKVFLLGKVAGIDDFNTVSINKNRMVLDIIYFLLYFLLLIALIIWAIIRWRSRPHGSLYNLFLFFVIPALIIVVLILIFINNKALLFPISL